MLIICWILVPDDKKSLFLVDDKEENRLFKIDKKNLLTK